MTGREGRTEGRKEGNERSIKGRDIGRKEGGRMKKGRENKNETKQRKYRMEEIHKQVWI